LAKFKPTELARMKTYPLEGFGFELSRLMSLLEPQ